MNDRVDYWSSLAIAVGFVLIYSVHRDEPLWLFSATFILIHTKGNQIISEVRKAALKGAGNE